MEIASPAGVFDTADPVTISITGGDPTREADRDIFPGNFLTNEQTGRPVMLESVYFAEISATVGGTALTALNAPAEVCFKVPAGLDSTYEAGARIPVYFFDPELGSWVREGQSRVEADSGQKRSCFTVDHLSWWNVDQPLYTHTTIHGKILDPEGNPYQNLYVSAVGVSYAGSSSASTDSNGEFCIDVKRGGETVKIRVGWDHYYGTASPASDNQVPTSESSAAAVVVTPDQQASCPQKIKYVGTLKFPKLDIRQVSFTDDHGDKFAANLGTGSPIALTDPVWTKDSAGAVTKNVPVVYKRGIPFKLGETKLKSDMAILPPLTATIHADGTDPYEFFTQGTIFGEFATLNNVAFGVATDKVDLLEPFTINWKYTYDGWNFWEAGTSTHTVYVTLRKPNPMQVGADPVLKDMLLLTIVDYAVRPAVGAQHEKTVMEKVFGRLSGLTPAGVPALGAVKQKVLNPVTGALSDGSTMTYYIPGGTRTSCPANPNPPSMLMTASGAGRCGDWAYFLGELLAVHGISSELTGVVVHESQVTATAAATTCTLREPYGFLLKNWSFTDPGTSGNAEFPYERNSAPAKAEFTDLAGVAGQGNANPPGWFWDHAFIKYDNKYYDSSYGIGSYATLNDYENAAIDGYARLNPPGAFDTPGVMTILRAFGKKNDPVKQEICVNFTETFPASPPDLPETLPPPPGGGLGDVLDEIYRGIDDFLGGIGDFFGGN